jgi:hypothetical protein
MDSGSSYSNLLNIFKILMAIAIVQSPLKYSCRKSDPVYSDTVEAIANAKKMVADKFKVYSITPNLEGY